MTRVLTMAAAVAALAASGGSQARAQSAYDYPYCAVYSGGGESSGARSCYYSSYAQCMATIAGIGGYCIESPYYNPPPQRPSGKRRVRTRER